MHMVKVMKSPAVLEPGEPMRTRETGCPYVGKSPTHQDPTLVTCPDKPRLTGILRVSREGSGVLTPCRVRVLTVGHLIYTMEMHFTYKTTKPDEPQCPW